jgi:hypothetical protein
MSRTSRLGLCFTLAATLVPVHALAGPINLRTVDTGNFTQLVDAFGSIGSTVNPLTDQNSAALFQVQPGLLDLTLFFENPGAALRDQNEFGVYSSANSNLRLPVFSGPTNPVTTVTLQFLPDGTLRISGVYGTDVPSFGLQFGFYLQNEFGTFYSEDSLNPGGNPQAFVYAGQGNAVNLHQAFDGTPGCQPGAPGSCASDAGRYYVAFEDLPFALTDRNFADMMVRVDSAASPVPEPASMVLFGSGLLGIASMARRQRGRRKAQSQK